MGIKDMSLDGCKLGRDSGENNSSSLDHGCLKNVENYKQDDGYNCGVFTLLMMIMIYKERSIIYNMYTLRMS